MILQEGNFHSIREWDDSFEMVKILRLEDFCQTIVFQYIDDGLTHKVKRDYFISLIEN